MSKRKRGRNMTQRKRGRNMSERKKHEREKETLGCNNRGGGGNFSKVKRFVAKWVGTRKRLFSSFCAAVV